MGRRKSGEFRINTPSKNGMYKGDEASYSAFHKRVVAERGKPQLCDECGETEGRIEWSNLSGNYTDVNDYARLCVSCHKRLDHDRRVEEKKMTSPVNGLNGGFRHSNRAILTEEQVKEAIEFRNSNPEYWSYNKLGKRYGVTAQAVFQAVKGIHWKHLHKKEG